MSLSSGHVHLFLFVMCCLFPKSNLSLSIKSQRHLLLNYLFFKILSDMALRFGNPLGCDLPNQTFFFLWFQRQKYKLSGHVSRDIVWSGAIDNFQQIIGFVRVEQWLVETELTTSQRRTAPSNPANTAPWTGGIKRG